MAKTALTLTSFVTSTRHARSGKHVRTIKLQMVCAFRVVLNITVLVTHGMLSMHLCATGRSTTALIVGREEERRKEVADFPLSEARNDPQDQHCFCFEGSLGETRTMRSMLD